MLDVCLRPSGPAIPTYHCLNIIWAGCRGLEEGQTGRTSTASRWKDEDGRCWTTKEKAESRRTGPDQVRPLPAGSNSADLRVVSLPSADASLSLPRVGSASGVRFAAQGSSPLAVRQLRGLLGMASGRRDEGSRWEGIGVVCRRLDGILAVLRLWAGGGYAVEAFLAPVPTNFSWGIVAPPNCTYGNRLRHSDHSEKWVLVSIPSRARPQGRSRPLDPCAGVWRAIKF